MQKKEDKLKAIVTEANNCVLCRDVLPYPPTPVFSVGAKTNIVIIGQAPGLIAHKNRTPFSDKSGDRLREWLQLDTKTFYDKNKIAIMPMGFCFPGYKNGADAPPRKECAPKWHQVMLNAIQPKIIILVGRYAQQYYLPQYSTLTEAIKHNEPQDKFIVLPHPSGRNNRWLAQNPWFEMQHLNAIAKRLVAYL